MVLLSVRPYICMFLCNQHVSLLFITDTFNIEIGDKIIKVWDSTSGAVLSTLEGHSDDVSSVAWSPDGSKIASGSDKMLRHALYPCFIPVSLRV